MTPEKEPTLPLSETDSVKVALPLIPVIGTVTCKPMASTGAKRPKVLPDKMSRLVSVVTLSAALMAPLASCGTTTSLPCPRPNNTNATSTSGNPIRCTTSNGSKYVWIPNRGGWVPSADGINPKPGAQGVGMNEQKTGVGGSGGSSSGG